jgi:hypothetical protein
MKKTALISFSTFILTVILSFVNPPIGPLNSEVKSTNEPSIPLTETGELDTNEILRNTLKKNFNTFDNFSARYKNTVLSWVGKSRDLDKNYIMQEVVDEYVGFKSYVINLGKILPYLLIVFSFFSTTIHLLSD